MATGIGVVVIGRNEGPRLQRCLASVLGMAQQIVYVDSGSTDGSVQMARGLGVEVVECRVFRFPSRQPIRTSALLPRREDD